MIEIPMVTSAWRRSWPCIRDSSPMWMMIPTTATNRKPPTTAISQLPVIVATLTPT